MFTFTVTMVAEFTGTADDAAIAAEVAHRAGLDIVWRGVSDDQLTFVARPRGTLSWVEANALSEMLDNAAAPMTLRAVPSLSVDIA